MEAGFEFGCQTLRTQACWVTGSDRLSPSWHWRNECGAEPHSPGPRVQVPGSQLRTWPALEPGCNPVLTHTHTHRHMSATRDIPHFLLGLVPASTGGLSRPHRDASTSDGGQREAALVPAFLSEIGRFLTNQPSGSYSQTN